MDMAKKQPAEDRDVLKLKLQVLHEYISHHERNLDQFLIDLRKADMFRAPEDLGGFVDRVTSILSDLYTADPPKSMIEEDLIGARAVINAVWSDTQEWAEIRTQEIKAGLVGGLIEAPFDSVLSKTMMNVFDRLARLQASGTSTQDPEEVAVELLTLMETAGIVFDDALDPARLLRERWIVELNGRTSTTPRGSARSGRRGRPKDDAVAVRNRQMREAWQTGKYRTHAELGVAFGVKVDVARKALRSSRGKPKADSRGSEEPVK